MTHCINPQLKPDRTLRVTVAKIMQALETNDERNLTIDLAMLLGASFEMPDIGDYCIAEPSLSASSEIYLGLAEIATGLGSFTAVLASEDGRDGTWAVWRLQQPLCCKATDPVYHALHSLLIPPRPNKIMRRHDVYALIDGERDLDEIDGTTRRMYSDLAYFDILRRYVDQAEAEGLDKKSVMALVRKIAGLAVRWMEQEGAPPAET